MEFKTIAPSPSLKASRWQNILQAYKDILSIDANDIDKVGTYEYPIPFFTEDILTDLCNEAILSLANSESLLYINAPVYIVGDLHGNFYDLIRIFLIAEKPPTSRFVFLGDYVDRGYYSTEVITLLLALYLQYPGHIILLRGNHEFSNINSMYGFKAELTKLYGIYADSLFNSFNEVFSYMPLAAVISNKIFCVHGGLSPHLKSLNDFDDFPRPLKNYDSPIISDLVWSDPSETVDNYEESKRGSGTYFGAGALHKFLKENNLEKVIRAHQCVQLGVQKFANDDLLTVFSCSRYVEASNNRCGLLFVPPDLKIQLFSLPPGFFIERSKAMFETISSHNNLCSLHSTNSMAISLSMQEITVRSSSRFKININKPTIPFQAAYTTRLNHTTLPPLI